MKVYYAIITKNSNLSIWHSEVAEEKWKYIFETFEEAKISKKDLESRYNAPLEIIAFVRI